MVTAIARNPIRNTHHGVAEAERDKVGLFIPAPFGYPTPLQLACRNWRRHAPYFRCSGFLSIAMYPCDPELRIAEMIPDFNAILAEREPKWHASR
jgi:hypothetical protein